MPGAGNIGRDDTVYADGAITREGPTGESTALEFSTGRGGAGNIGKSPRLGPQVDSPRHSTDIVPELATREAQDEFHTGVCYHYSPIPIMANGDAARRCWQCLQGEAWRTLQVS